MNTKKITALALAALMAAGSTGAAFAADISDNKDQALVFSAGTVYEENDNGVLEETDKIVNPGDSLYFLLEDGSFTGITDKERDRINVYADWKLGKEYIEDIDVIYKKGAAVGNYTYTITAASGYFNTNNTLQILGTMKYTDLDSFKAAIPQATMNAALAADYNNTKTSGGFVYEGKFYNNTQAGLEALLEAHPDWTKGKGSGDITVTDTATANGLGSYVATGSDNSSDYYLNEEKGLCIKVGSTGSGDVSTIAALLAAADTDTDFDGTYTFEGIVPISTDYYVKGSSAVSANGTPVLTKAEAEEAIKNTITAAVPNAGVALANDYTYWVEVQTKSDLTTKELDLAGTLYLGTTKNGAEKNGDDLSVNMTLTNRLYDSSNNFLSVEDEVTIDPDANGAVKFASDAEEVEIIFGENEDARFVFDAQGQTPLNFAYTTKFNKEIADLFPKANIDFITFTAAPATNRTGDLYIAADEDTYLYEVTDKGVQTVAYLPAAGNGAVSAALGLKDINGAEYDEDEGAWHIRTRKLGSYAISDMELDTSITVDGDETSSNSSTDNGDKPNPDTGR